MEGDDFNEPVADAARSILDGHIILSRQLANTRHFPAVDVLESVSRVREAVVSREHREAADTVLRLLGVYRSHEDLIAVGAYKAGSDPEMDTAIRFRDPIRAFLCQRPDEACRYEEAVDQVIDLSRQIRCAHEGGLACRE